MPSKGKSSKEKQSNPEAAPAASDSDATDGVTAKKSLEGADIKKRKREENSAVNDQDGSACKLSKTVFVQNLPFTFTDSQLEEIFSQFGPVRRCFIVKPKGSEHHRGYGFVQFASVEDVKRAIESTNGLAVDGRKIKVDLAKKRSSFEERRAKKQKGQQDIVGETKISNEIAPNERNKKAGREDDASHCKKAKVSRYTQLSDEVKALQGQRVARTVVLGGLVDLKMKEEVLAKAKDIGAIESVIDPLPDDVLQTHDLSRDGCVLNAAAVLYKSVSTACQAVVSLHRQKVGGGTVWARQLGGEGSKLRKWRLIVRNLPFQVSEDELRKKFSQAGFVWGVTLPGQGDRSLSKGFAFVSFTCKKDAEKAISSMNGVQIGKRTVAVDWAVPKKKYETATTMASTSGENCSAPASGSEGDESSSESEDDSGEYSSSSEKDGSASEQFDIAKELDTAHKVINNIISSGKQGENAIDGKDVASDSNRTQNTKKEKHADLEKDMDNGDKLSKQKASQPKRKESLERTIFVKNLPFDINIDEIKSKFSVFGEIKSVHCVCHKITRRPKGTAFIEFKEVKGAETAISAADTGGGLQDTGIMMKGRLLAVFKAVDEQTANKKAQEKAQNKEKDHRNLYLLKEGIIKEGTPAAIGVSKEDLLKRQEIAQKKAIKLRSPNFHVSRSRLCVYNLPNSITEKKLKKLFIDAVKSRAYKQNPVIKQVKILKDAKGSSSGNKSRGIAFIEFTEHEHALVALRVLNNNPETFCPERRPIVEFAVEDIRKVQVHQKSRLVSGKGLECPANESKVSESKMDTKKQTNSNGAKREEDGKEMNSKRNKGKKTKSNLKEANTTDSKQHHEHVRKKHDRSKGSQVVAKESKSSCYNSSDVSHSKAKHSASMGGSPKIQSKANNRKPMKRKLDNSESHSDKTLKEAQRKKKKKSEKEIQDDLDILTSRYRSRLFSDGFAASDTKSKQQTARSLQRWFD
eukprot:TRINITY_DN2064_c0_g1_i1.p1 TRINITY_DN2064_c0_g1~~TRINITY_DN2064_c0_g1_i1.p1  ORF type:complete len:973 (-),score=289.26 TRINITY_DN2064_c0_g1_i1:319-3237(-)